jgi:hypothetical protein
MAELPTDSTVESLIGATKLTLTYAKTLVYWRLTNPHVEQMRFIPKLALVGPSGSGKTTNMEAAKAMPGESSPIVPCALLTMATCRDLLAEWKNKLFIADEADDLRPDVNMLFMARSNREMALINYKEPISQNKYKQSVADIFGPTLIHHRNEIEDPAQSSRSIQIFTRYEDGPFTEFEADLDALNSIKLDMSSVPRYGGRELTTWAPVLYVAEQVGDHEFVREILAEMEVQKQLLREKSEYDTASLVLSMVVQVVASKTHMHRWDRIDIEHEIGQPIRDDFPNLSPLTIASTLRSLGFYTERRGGRRVLYPEKNALELAARRRNYQDTQLEKLIRDETLDTTLDRLKQYGNLS